MSNAFTVLQGDNLARLRELEDESVDSIVTDPPYGLSREPDMAEVLRHWLAGDDYAHNGAGFMGRSWDSFVPGPAVWREAFRVLKPGAHVFAFSGTRTYDMAVLAMRLAGFEIRDQFAWVYGSGMPKSRKLGGGWGTGAKPAWEPIVLARKPFRGSIYANHQANGLGGLNIDACRIPLGEETLREGAGSTWNTMHAHEGRKPVSDAERYRRNCSGDRGHDGTRGGEATGATDLRTGGGKAAEGRWPANLLHDGSDEVLAGFPSEAGANAQVMGTEPSASTTNTYGARDRTEGAFHGDSGSAARFFYCGKATPAEREAGLEHLADKVIARSNGAQANAARGESDRTDSFNAERIRKNDHPTVKPIAVGRWLQRLITPPGGVTLDLYAGSGSFGASAILEGFRPILLELDRDDDGKPLGYIDLINGRCNWAIAERARETEAAAVLSREAAFKRAQISIFEAAT